VVIDVELDTGSAPGRHVARVLREIERLERHPPPGHPRRGRPPLHQRAPDLARRIERLRDSGLSLQAIADALNADGAPTPRGGAEWRPSSVQAALGYRRPRPPAPDAPPPPPRPRPPAPGAPPPPPPRPPHRRR
jgi:hypothetical protein